MNRIKNYIGTEIGKFTVLNQKRENRKTYLYCKCQKCGKEQWILQGKVNKIKCCDRNHSSTEFKALELQNKKINNILILEKTEKRKNGAVIWKCQCFCGNTFLAPLYRIKNGEITSCGCKRKVFREGNFAKAINKNKKNFVEGTCLSLIKNSKLRKNNKSGYTGVTQKNGKWAVRITVARKNYWLGTFTDIEQAIKARKEAEEKYFKPILEKYNKGDD